MRALVVCAAPVEGSAELVSRLAPLHAMVVGVDGGASVCLDAGVTPTLVVGDLDSLPQHASELLSARGVEFLVFPAEKDETDIELALRAVRDRGAEEVTVTAAFAGRIDHTLANTGAIARFPALRPRVVEPGFSAWVLSPHGQPELQVSGPGPTLSLLAIGGAAEVSVEGVRWSLSKACLKPLDSWGVSNVVTSAIARVQVAEGVVLAVVPDLG